MEKESTMKRKLLLPVLALLVVLLAGFTAAPQSALTQGETTPQPSTEYSLHMARTFGYGSGTGDIRGNFRASLQGPEENVSQVEFLLDGEVMATVTEAPFALDFVTSDYPDGEHMMAARVTLNDGSVQTTAERHYNFVSAEEEAAGTKRVMLPILGLVAVITVGGVVIQAVVMRKKPLRVYEPGEERAYGLYGGTICPNCKRPVPLHWYGLKVSFVGRYDHCDICGRRGMFKVEPLHTLREAEAAERREAQKAEKVMQGKPEDRLRDQLDDSKFMDS
jgi:hypothetical protein